VSSTTRSAASSTETEWENWDEWSKARLRWIATARDNQVTPPGEWLTWLVMAGRGFGKTRLGAEDAADFARKNPGARLAFVGPTIADTRDTMIEGQSGLLACVPAEALRGGSIASSWNRSMGELFFANGCKVKAFSAEEPERLRGPQHHRVWADELGAWTREETWDQLQFGLRLGARPQVVVTTTPKPSPLMRRIIEADTTLITRGSTFDNAANLSPAALAVLRDRYEGTRLGRQELFGEFLTDTPGALWTAAMLDEHRVTEAPEIVRIVVAVDPAVTSGEDADETGIVAVGKGSDGRAYVLADRSCRESPAGWAHRAVGLFHELGSIGTIVGEANQGGDLIEATLRAVDPGIPYIKINAKQGKRLRAEPIAALYEQGRVSHVGPDLKTLEDQMTGWLPDSGYSPDRLDALVHAIAELKLANGSQADRYFAAIAPPCPSCGVPNLPEATECSACRKPLSRGA